MTEEHTTGFLTFGDRHLPVRVLPITNENNEHVVLDTNTRMIYFIHPYLWNFMFVSESKRKH
jgi:hypothetical protein